MAAKFCMNKNIKKIIFAITVFFILLFLTQPQLAAADDLLDKTNINEQNQVFVDQAGLKTENPVKIISYIIKAVLSFLGVIFISLTIYAGILWMTSTGNEEKISKAKAIIIGAAIGLAICLSAYAITVFVLDRIITPMNTEQTA